MPERRREPPLDHAAMKAFAHPLRIRMFAYLTDRGAATATQLAEQLGESSAQTSYHLRQLARHGLVEEDAGRGTGRERWWQASSFSIPDAQAREDPALRSLAGTVLSGLLEQRVLALRTWFEDAQASPSWVEASLQQSTTASLTLDEFAAMNDAVQEVLEEHTNRASRRRESGEGAPSDERRVRMYYDAFPLPTGD
ncbi:winged helix-turn-helix domain-containing protein [Ruania halotolerans]|uniref:winged helix-turn-helix domain-containing protein n=1 Tax=Ruania halotolerans TaxID=2897773 RepID=UPI001E5231C0|nr:helix-turn-helix domain-containing protein [Ruania halotolerans]UFU05855.1 helix-turn-helix domain-containing protein [Ruania halotolerans]